MLPKRGVTNYGNGSGDRKTKATGEFRTYFRQRLYLYILQIVEVRVPNLDCEGCASKLKKALSKLKGVEEVEVEMEIQKIIVRGYALEEKKVVKAIKKAGKAAEPWPFPGYSHFASFYKYPTYIVNHYYDTYKNQTTTGVHTFFHTPSVYSVAVASDEAIASLFSDDNPHACAIM
ncbi:hypothetical protein ACFX13_002009 [Malus domestica]|uniref:HMA domain-containing protein n=1 Tax=Malus domestica TaxID=3750 RepID=A0A498KL08_MALDO|nr:hypothetical protein DVH24_022552 [Malus domestica]